MDDPVTLTHLRTPHRNVLVCIPGRPWSPWDLANFWEGPVVDGSVGTFTVEHFAATDSREAVEGSGLPRWDANREQRTDNVHVGVFHGNVDHWTRICQTCGTQVGTP